MNPSRSPGDVNWAVLLRNAQVVDLAAVRQMQEAHRRLFHFDGPPAVGAFVRTFRLINLFALFAMKDKRFPVLSRAWADLQWIARHPEADEFTVESWLLLDLPVTDDGRTVVEVFRDEIGPDSADLRAFVEMTRKSRYGIYIDDGGTRQSHRLLELIPRRRTTVTRSIHSERGELIWTRIVQSDGMTFMLGDTRGWPASNREAVTEMLLDRLEASRWMTAEGSPESAYEKFMKLTGPYWMSVFFARSDHDPVLPPDHYLSYSRGPVPNLVPPR